MTTKKEISKEGGCYAYNWWRGLGVKSVGA